VSFHCVLKNKFGRVLSSTFNQDVITQPGGHEPILTGLAEGLQNLVKGEHRSIALSAERAYGFYDPSKVIECDREDIPDGRRLRKGDEIRLPIEDGDAMNLRVVGIRGDRLVLDGNHPLAGQDLIFEIVATAARDATYDEIQEIDTDPQSGHLH
jgi:FKBP-type peptidyl-prolyl cis-trans isomerase SlyD